MSARQIIPQTHDPCALCHKPNATKRCGRCRAVVYCSRDCQATHWKRAHKLTCGAAPPPVPPRPQTPGELAEDCARQLAEQGYAALGPLVDRDRRNALRTHARHEVERLLKLPLAAANARFAKIRSPEHRHAVALDLTPAVRDVVGELAVAYDACRAAFCGDEPEIVELGCLVSDAGAAARPWHADADATFSNTRQLVLLVNFDERAVAATELLPGTHAPTFHAHVRDAFGGRLPDPPGMPALRAFDRAGAAVLYDAALLYPVWKTTSALGVYGVWRRSFDFHTGSTARRRTTSARDTCFTWVSWAVACTRRRAPRAARRTRSCPSCAGRCCGTSSSACATSAPRAGRGTWGLRIAWRR